MSIEQEIAKAIGAHAKWKLRLHFAIESGVIDHKFDKVSRDDACAFGQSLSGLAISETTRSSACFTKVAGLHKKFHDCSGRIIKLVSQNGKSAADALLAGEYTTISLQLATAMIDWKHAIEQGHADG